ncbi:DUF6882 domain-containing protein [Streptomonospora nanhaiensis]|uniref:DUF6882 domain-containing protein n=1 Tax=Streptomonospora nanhaiensis TaxID=1323731 RepID=UPI001C38B5E4|nr:DUF6882 domain-containing protein [Streptomonospora nanhaiensis]MBV2364033.1 hypothetical protein [Streptomonospora nanhaiensis]MBX9387377.1 hypothetical protein [Streptomonospora nanhaiensis]
MTEPTQDQPPQEPRRWFSPAMERAGAAYSAWAAEQTETYNTHHPTGDWHVDVEASTFRQGDKTVRVAPLGTFGTDGSWVWAWANPHMHPPGSPRLAASIALREFGQQYDIPELVTPRLEFGDFADPRMAAERLCLAATGTLSGYGYASVTANTGARFAMMVVDDVIPRAEFDLVTLPRRIMQGIEIFPFDQPGTVHGYLARHGFTVERTGEQALRGVRPECTVTAEFNEHRALAHLSVQNTPS